MRSPLLGYNHNLKYKERVYHIQTEDSGESNPHIFTHLFHNGIIIATQKTDYSHLLPQPDYEETLHVMMQNQHKDMMKKLLKGVFDEKIIRYFGSLIPGENEDGGLVSQSFKNVMEAENKSGEEKAISSSPVKPSQPSVAVPSIPQNNQVPPPPPDPPAPTPEPPKQPVIPMVPPPPPQEDTEVTIPEHLGDTIHEIHQDASTYPPYNSEPDYPPPPPPQEDTGVVIARPAIILAGEPSPKIAPANKHHTSGLIKITNTPKNNQDINDTIPTADEELLPPPPKEEKRHFTGPVKAPPGVYKPENSKDVPKHIESLKDIDTKVDDIILAFLKNESLQDKPSNDK